MLTLERCSLEQGDCVRHLLLIDELKLNGLSDLDRAKHDPRVL